MISIVVESALMLALVGVIAWWGVDIHKKAQRREYEEGRAMKWMRDVESFRDQGERMANDHRKFIQSQRMADARPADALLPRRRPD